MLIELITHSGPFQADDVLAYAMLQLVYPNHVLIRTRDPDIISRAADSDPTSRVIFDVGGIYDQGNLQFDHHGDRAENLPHYNQTSVAPMASCGLVYKAFKRLIVESILKDTTTAIDDKFYDLVYKNFIHDFDAIDNGVYNSPGGLRLFLEQEQNGNDSFQIGFAGDKYNMYSHLASCVNLMNIPNCSDADTIKARFCQVADLLKTIFCSIVHSLWNRHTFKQTVKRIGPFAVYPDTVTPKCSPHNGTFHVYRDHQNNYCLYTSNSNIKLSPETNSKEFVFLHKNRFVCKYKNVHDFETYLMCIVAEHGDPQATENERLDTVKFIISQFQ